MTFGQLIEYNMRKIFIEKLYTKCGGKLFPDPILNNQNLAYLWINSLKFYTISFYCIPNLGLLKYEETKLETICFYLI